MAASMRLKLPKGVNNVNNCVMFVHGKRMCRGSRQVVVSLTSQYLPQKRCYSSQRNILALRERGIIQNIFPDTSDLPKVLSSGPQCIYCGFDPTADSLHIGNLLAIVALLHCQRAGHKPIALIGGATALIGDPSGKTTEREPLDSTVVQSNAVSIESSLQRIFTNHERYFWKEDNKQLPEIRILDNKSWYKDLNVIRFLAGVGRQLRMGKLLSRQSVQTRLASSQGMSFAEFSYQLFQAYDFLHLYHEYGCLIQLGGTDQLGNLMTGHDLVRKVTGKDVYGITIPLVTSSTGDKLGKTAGNAVWINEDQTSPLDLYQYFLRLPDVDMEPYLKLFTFLPLNEIADIIRLHKKTPKNRKAQAKLAEQVLLLVHGENGLDKAMRQTEALYHTSPASLEQLNDAEITELFQGATVTRLLLEPGFSIAQMLDRVECLPTGNKGDLILSAGGVHINNQPVTDASRVLIRGEHILENGLTLIRVGKKNYYIVKWV